MAHNLCYSPSSFYTQKASPWKSHLLTHPTTHASSHLWRNGISQPESYVSHLNHSSEMCGRTKIVARSMLSPRKFLQKRKKLELIKDGVEGADQKNWWRLMKEIEDTGSAVSVLKRERIKNSLSRDMVLGTMVRFKQLQKWNLVGEVLEWLRTEHWWDFNEMDFLMLVTAYGKQGNFIRAEKVLGYMNKKGYAPNVVSHTALMEAYGKGGQYKNAEAIFRRMQSSGPEPSALTYQIIFKLFIKGGKFTEAEEVFETLLNEEKSPLKPDQKMFHMMIYMHKKVGNYKKARQVFSLMVERGIPQSTITFNSLMSFETNYKEVSKIYDQMQRSGHNPDVVSYALLIRAYGKSRREEEALAVFEDMLNAGVRPTRKAYNILLDAFAISGMVEQARIVFKSMRRDRYTPDLCSYTTMLLAYVNASDMEGAEKFFKRLKVDGIEASVVTYGTLIKGYAKATNLEKMMEKYEAMLLSGIRPNQTILTTIMDAYGKNKDFGSAVIWYEEMEKYGLPPDQKAKNILLSLAKTPDGQKEANKLVGNADNCGTSRSLTGASSCSSSEYDEDDKGEHNFDADEDGEDRDYDSKLQKELTISDVGSKEILDGLHTLNFGL